VQAEKIYTCSWAYNKLMTKIKKHRPAAVWLRRLSYLEDTLFAISSPLSSLGQRASGKIIYTCSWALFSDCRQFDVFL